MDATQHHADVVNDAERLTLGAHVVTPRVGYSHHGIYVGNGRVVQYRGFERGWRLGPIEAVSMEEFTRGRPLCVVNEASLPFSSKEIVQRAMSRIGEDRYHVLNNNCEHFCEWCVRAEQRSYQVERLLCWLHSPLRFTRRVSAFVTRMLALLVSAVSCHLSDRGCSQ